MKEEPQLSMEEELKIIYFKIVDLSTKKLLKRLGAMVRDTFKVLGFTSPQEYCRRKLKWSYAYTKDFLKCTEIRYLKDRGADREYKLLTKVWKELGVNVVQKIDSRRLVLQKAIFDPPLDLNEERLGELVKKLMVEEEELRYAVRTACHALLEEEMRSLFESKRKIASVVRKILYLKEELCFFSVSKAVSLMRVMCDETYCQDGSCHEFGSDASICENVPPNFDDMINEVNSCCDEPRKISGLLVNIKRMYFDLIWRSILPDKEDTLDLIHTGDISHQLIQNWRRELQRLQQDFESRLEALGRSECSSYHAAFCSSPVDVNRWLLTQKGEPQLVSEAVISLVKLDTGEAVMLEQLFGDRKPGPRVVMVYGPAGSGKTWLCHYLQEEWRSGRSSLGFIKELQLFVFLTESNVHQGSFSHHLKNVMFPRVMAGVCESQVIESLCRFKVCFVMDASGGCKTEFPAAASEVLHHVNSNNNTTAIITARPEARTNIHAAVNNVPTDEVYLQPLQQCQIKDLCLNYLKVLNIVDGESMGRMGTWCKNNILRSNIKEDFVLKDDPAVLVEKFTQKLQSEERNDLCYPLPLAYLLWLWLKDPKNVIEVTNISKLFARVIAVCEQMSKTNTNNTGSRTEKMGNVREYEQTRDLASRASAVFSSKTTSLWEKEDLNDYKSFGDSLYPFLGHLRRYPAHPTKTWQFLHPFLVEVLCAWDIHKKTLDRGFRGILFPRWKRVNRTENKGATYVSVIRLLGGFSCIENKSVPATAIVKLFKCGDVAKNDYSTWLSLLHETSWSSPVRKAVKCAIKSSKTWKVSQANSLEVTTVVNLIRHHVYCPRTVIIDSKPAPEVITVLANHPKIDVRIIPQMFKSSNFGDTLLDALREAGNVTEFEGEIRTQGADALGHMTRLRSLTVHLTSLAVITALSTTLTRLLALRELHLHFGIGERTPVGMIPRLSVLPCHANAHVNLYGITSNTYKWAIEVCRKVKCHRKEVYLRKSSLSPDLLQEMKDQLRPTVVHISL